MLGKTQTQLSPALRNFLIAAGFCLTVFLVNVVFFEVRPYNIWGLSYGIAATCFMTGTALLSLRRRMTRLALRLRLGSARGWLQLHLYGGVLFLLLVLMHSGFQLPTGILTWTLWTLSVWTTLTGLAGVLLQKWIPKILTSGLAIEVVYERIPELIDEIREEVQTFISNCAQPIRDFYSKNLAAALATPQPRLIYYIDITGGIQARIKQFDYLRRFLSTEEKNQLENLEILYRTKLEIDAHYTLQKALRWWLYTHIPPSLVLLVLTVYHIWAVLYY